jgi:hypothetical protein
MIDGFVKSPIPPRGLKIGVVLRPSALRHIDVRLSPRGSQALISTFFEIRLNVYFLRIHHDCITVT